MPALGTQEKPFSATLWSNYSSTLHSIWNHCTDTIFNSLNHPQEAEDACPTPNPLRPRIYSESDCESDVEYRRLRLQRTPTPVFTRSKAYEPPKWAPNLGADCDEWSGRQKEQEKPGHTKIIRFNRQELKLAGQPMDPGLAESAEFVTRMARQVEMERLEASSKLRQTKPLSPTLFVPAKFVPGPPTSHDSLLADRMLGNFSPECDDVVVVVESGGAGEQLADPALERRS